MSEYLKIVYYISTFILAIFAILGFAFSVYSSNQVGKVLVKFRDELNSYMLPTIKFQDYRWAVEKNGDPSLKDIPIGVYFDFKNVSNVPIQILDSKPDYYFDKTKIIIERIRGGKTIIVPGENFQNYIISPDLFQNYFKNSKGFEDNSFFKIHCNVTFSRLHDSRKFKYIAIQKIIFDPKNPKIKSFSKEKEEIVEIKQ